MGAILTPRQLFELGNIRSGRIACECGGEVAFYLWSRFPERRYCRTSGWAREDLEREAQLVDFTHPIAVRTNGPPARLGFEVDAPTGE